MEMHGMPTEIQNITNESDIHDEEGEGELDESVLESQGLTVDKSHISNGHNDRQGEEDEDEEVIAEAETHGRLQRQLESETIQHLNNFQQQMASMQQHMEQEAFRQQIEREAANLPSLEPSDPALQVIQRQIEEAAMAASNALIDAIPVEDANNQTPNKRRKHDKDQQLNTCLAANCDRQIKQRRLCPMHQKQKERSGGKLELKENVKFTKGRTPTPFSKHANKYAKLKTFDKKIDEWAGGRDEGSMMLEAYIDSSYYQARFQKQEDAKIYESIGKNIIEFMKQLPEKSPLRRPLIKAVSENVPLARLREVLPVSKQTVINSKKLSDQDNLLLTIKYKPNVTRNRKHMLDAMGQPLVGNNGEEGTLIGNPDEMSSGHGNGGNDDMTASQHLMQSYGQQMNNNNNNGNNNNGNNNSLHQIHPIQQAISDLRNMNQLGQLNQINS
jgi:hypothetical protein